MIRFLLVITGSIFVGIGVIGIAVPGLPTTPFLLLSAACYVRSSPRLYNWVIHHRVFGKYARLYHEHRAMTYRSKVASLVTMWVMILISAFILIKSTTLSIIVLVAGVTGTFFITRIKTYRGEEKKEER